MVECGVDNCTRRGNGDIEQALRLAKKENADDLREAFDIIDENGACAVNQMYRERRTTLSFSRTVEVEMAIFGLSMMAWPFPKSAGA